VVEGHASACHIHVLQFFHETVRVLHLVDHLGVLPVKADNGELVDAHKRVLVHETVVGGEEHETRRGGDHAVGDGDDGNGIQANVVVHRETRIRVSSIGVNVQVDVRWRMRRRRVLMTRHRRLAKTLDEFQIIGARHLGVKVDACAVARDRVVVGSRFLVLGARAVHSHHRVCVAYVCGNGRQY